MYKKKTGIDIIAKILDALYAHNPDALFVMSLMHQYEERGSLSKKQLQGLYGKASKIEGLPPGKLATIEAIIKRMPTRYKSELPEPTPLFEKEESMGILIEKILARFPQHKRVLFLKAKYDNNELLSPADMNDLKRFGNNIK